MADNGGKGPPKATLARFTSCVGCIVTRGTRKMDVIRIWGAVLDKMGEVTGLYHGGGGWLCPEPGDGAILDIK